MTPGALGSNPRVVKEADALARAGWEVRVISTRTLDAVDFRDEAVLRGSSWSSHRIDLRDRHAWRRRRLVQLAARLGYSSFGIGDLIEASYSPFVSELKRAVGNRAPARLYIAHYVAALPAAARAAARHGAAYAFDAEDFHLGDLPDAPEHALEKRIIRAIEARYLPGTAYVTAASPLIADAYAETYGIASPTVILNVFPKANAPSAPSPGGSKRPGPSLYWFSQTIGPGRGLETAIEAIARAESRPHLYLRGAPAAGFDAHLRSLAERAGVAGRLHLLDPAPPDDLERLGSVYDLGYVGERTDTPNRQIALTNKLFSYLIGGVPILATDIPAHRRLAPDLGEAISLSPTGDAAELSATLDRFLLHPGRLASARADAWSLGQMRFNWDVEQRRLVELIEQLGI